jgi:hypothetical protein
MLTERGHALIAEARPAHAALVRALFIDALGPDCINHLAATSDKILQALEAHRDTASSPHSFWSDSGVELHLGSGLAWRRRSTPSTDRSGCRAHQRLHAPMALVWDNLNIPSSPLTRIGPA